MQHADSDRVAGYPAERRTLAGTLAFTTHWHRAWQRARHAVALAAFLLAGALTAHAQPYAVTNLGINGWVPPNGINDLGQVAGTGYFPSGQHAFFFDGANVIDLGTLPFTDINGDPPNFSWSYAAGLNNAGQVTGTSFSYFSNYPWIIKHVFSWTQAGGMVDVGTLGGRYVEAGGINDTGQVTGRATLADDSESHAFIWTQAGGMIDLGFGDVAEINGINDSGQVAGDVNGHAFLWTQTGGMIDLGTLGGSSSETVGINDAGQVAGRSATAGDSSMHAFLHDGANMIDLGTLSANDINGDPPYYSGSYATGLNNVGQTIGYAYNYFNNAPWFSQSAFSWTLAGGMVDLGTFGVTFSHPYDINDAGQVVGTSYSINHAVLHDGVMLHDLNTLLSNPPPGLELYEAIAISETGIIAASSNVGLMLLTGSAAAPALGPIALSTDPVAVNTLVTASAGFTDADAADTHTASFNFGDGSPAAAGAVTESAGAGTASGFHSFAAAGIYPITLTVTDSSGLSSQVSRDIVVYDPSAGFVTGGGWFFSPPGAYVEEPTLGGRATFGFVSKYLKGATVPTGNTEFQFQAVNLKFHSDSYDWLVVGGARAQYKGVGTINGLGEYKFLLTAVDGALLGTDGQDRFRIKIWYHDADLDQDVIVYDNQLDSAAIGSYLEGTLLGGGSIVIHKK